MGIYEELQARGLIAQVTNGGVRVPRPTGRMECDTAIAQKP